MCLQSLVDISNITVLFWFILADNSRDVYMMCRKHGKHEDDGADGAGNTGIILLLTCIPGYQMWRMLLTIFRRLWRTVHKSRNMWGRQHECCVLQDQEAFIRSAHDCEIFLQQLLWTQLNSTLFVPNGGKQTENKMIRDEKWMDGTGLKGTEMHWQ